MCRLDIRTAFGWVAQINYRWPTTSFIRLSCSYFNPSSIVLLLYLLTFANLHHCQWLNVCINRIIKINNTVLLVENDPFYSGTNKRSVEQKQRYLSDASAALSKGAYRVTEMKWNEMKAGTRRFHFILLSVIGQSIKSPECPCVRASYFY